MITRGDIRDVYGGALGDLGFSLNPFKAVRSGVKATTSLVRGAPGAFNRVGRFAGDAAFFAPNLALQTAVGAGKAIGKGAGGIVGTTLGLPFGILRSVGSGLSSRFKQAAGGTPGSSSPSPATQAAAMDVATSQAAGAGGGYSGSGVPSSGSTGGGSDDSVGKSSSALSVDPNAAPQAAPQTLMEKFAAMSIVSKLAIVGGLAGAGYFGYKKLSRRRGGRRSKS